MAKGEERARLEAVLTILQMARVVAMPYIEDRADGLFLHVIRGDQFDGDDLAKHISELSEGAVAASRIKVRVIGQSR